MSVHANDIKNVFIVMKENTSVIEEKTHYCESNCLGLASNLGSRIYSGVHIFDPTPYLF